MFILITSEENNSCEKEQLLRFFEKGLPLLHVRKPGMTEKELGSWMMDFGEEHLNRMVLHQHHRLAEAFPVKGIHLKEGFRKEQKEVGQYVKRFRSKGLTASTSFHDPATLEEQASGFDYVFLSPVFNSFSKSGYEGQGFDVQMLSRTIIALGGVDATNISAARSWGYDGVAVLGAIWLAEDKQELFNEIYNEYNNVYR